MTHPSVEEVAEHVTGALVPEAEQRVRAHLRRCRDCAATAEELAGLPDRLRTAATAAPPMPEHLARRVESAIAGESRRRQAGPVAEVAALDERRRRRRRGLAGGLLAAAAATVVAVTVGDVLQRGVSGEAARPAEGGSAGTTSLAEPPHAAEPRRDTRAKQPRALADTLRDGGLATVARPRAALIDRVATAHTAGSPRHDRPGCVAAALGDAARAEASYSVPVPGGRAAGVVVLRPSEAPTEGVLVACAPEPRVLLRRGLREPRE